MAAVSYVLVKVVRISGWPLLVLVLTYFVTGYAMTGRYGFGAVMGPGQAWELHRMLHVPLGVLLLAHTLPATYLALRRWWGWIRRKSSR